jgi:hypothetical protein
MKISHLKKLNEVADRFGVKPLKESMSPTEYLSYALDLMCLELGIMNREDFKND